MFSLSTVTKALLVLALGVGAYVGGRLDLSTDVKTLGSRLEARVKQEIEETTTLSPHASAAGSAETGAKISAEAKSSGEAQSGELTSLESGAQAELDAALNGVLETGAISGEASGQGNAAIQLGAGLGVDD